MRLTDAMTELGVFTVLGLVGDVELGAEAAEDVAASGLPYSAVGCRVSDSLRVVVARAARMLARFDRLIVAGPELDVLEHFVRAGATTPLFLALSSGVPDAIRDRVRANVPPELDVTVVRLPTMPAGDVSPLRTALLAVGFDAGAGMTLLPAATVEILSTYRAVFLWETVLLEPLGRPMYERPEGWRPVSTGAYFTDVISFSVGAGDAA